MHKTANGLTRHIVIFHHTLRLAHIELALNKHNNKT